MRPSPFWASHQLESAISSNLRDREYSLTNGTETLVEKTQRTRHRAVITFRQGAPVSSPNGCLAGQVSIRDTILPHESPPSAFYLH